MTDLERFAAALLAQWRAEGGQGGGPIGIDAILDRTMPYRVARRLLGIDISEDYEALVLRLIAGDEALASTSPEEAGEMARATMADKLPDLDTLRLLRSASITLGDDAIANLGDVAFGGARAEADAKWSQAERASQAAARRRHRGSRAGSRCPSDAHPRRPGMPPVSSHPSSRRDRPRLPPVGGGVHAARPLVLELCDELPSDRVVKFCPSAGRCSRRRHAFVWSGTAHWKHCPECGTRVTSP